MQLRFTNFFRPLLLGTVLVGSGSIATLLLRKPVMAQSALAGFNVTRATFDASVSKKPELKIPKSWRFVGVSHGFKANETNLWFQDSEGNLFMVIGFVDESDHLVVQDTVNRISTE